MVEMNEKILDVILAVLSYKTFTIRHNRVCGTDHSWFYETEKYYQSLSLPEGMNKNRSDYERVLSWENSDELEKAYNMQTEDLKTIRWK